MQTSIETQTQALTALRAAAGQGLLRPFIGAGASRMAGCPNWAEFADSVLKHFVENHHLNHAQMDQLKHLNPRVKLSIARGLERLNPDPGVNFQEIIQPAGTRNSASGIRLYSALSRLSKVFVTTNYDEWLDKVVAPPKPDITSSVSANETPDFDQRTVIYRKRDLKPEIIDQQNTVIHLHGSVIEPSGMIVTTSDYIDHYRNDRISYAGGAENYVLTFLEQLFRHKMVLFIGYGLEELEILEYVIQKGLPATAASENKEIRHYILQGFFSHQEHLRLSMAKYFSDWGVGLIPFSLDEKGFGQLLDELDALASLVTPSETLLAERMREMEGLLP